MAWSAKIIQGDGGVQGINEFELIYDAASQTEYKQLYGFSLGSEAPDVLYHTPDNGSPVPVRANGRNRTIFLKFHVPEQSGWDDVLNPVTKLKRLVDGPSSQAIRAQTVGDVDVVRVAIKPDGATYTTYFDVIDGFVDDSGAYGSSLAYHNRMAYEITVALTCKPYGYGDSFVLENALVSSAHFLEDSNSDGLADGWFKTGTGTTTISTNALTGHQSQKFTTSSINAGIFQQLTASGTSAAIYIVARMISGSAVVVLRNSTAAVNVASVTINSANATKTYKDDDGNEWLRIEITNTSIVNGNVYILYVLNGAASACEFEVDHAYLQWGTSEAPPAFSSSSALKNCYAPTVATTNINYLDVWGIPGDAPALITTKLTYDYTSGEQAETVMVHGDTDGILPTSEKLVVLESSLFSASIGTWSTVSDATYTGGSALQLASASATGRIDYLSTGGRDFVRQFIETPRRVYAVIRASSSAVTFSFSIYLQDLAGNTKLLLSKTGVTTASSASSAIVDLGTILYSGIVPASSPDSGTPELGVQISIANAASQTATVDSIRFMPADPDNNLIFQSATDIGDEKQVWLDAAQKKCLAERVGSYEPHLGNAWYLRSGNVMTRRYFTLYGGTNDVTVIAHGLSVELEITPRTTHLLGTV